MYAKRDNSADYGSLLQIQKLLSDRKMFGRAEDLSVFAIPGGRSRGGGGGGSECRPLTSDFDAKKFTK